MKYWVISPNVNNSQATIEDWKKTIIQYQAVFMGYDDNSLGIRFIDEISIGDVVVIAGRSNPNKELLACGRVNSEAKNDLNIPPLDYGNYRELYPFVVLKINPIDYGLDFTNASYLSAQQTPSIYELNPATPGRPSNKLICEFLENQLRLSKIQKEREQMEKTLKNFGQIILQGPPGTSKTWTAKQLAATLLEIDISKANWKDELEKQRISKGGKWAIVQFHPSYNYEDFVRGIQVKTTGTAVSYDAVNRILGKMAEAAQGPEEVGPEEPEDQPSEESTEGKEEHIQQVNKSDRLPYVLIIDEINRANLAAVLGELIYALEYRGEEVDTPYEVGESNSLKVPKNLYIIGTMNTADRSVGHIDYAVRRRFVFVSLLPKGEILEKFYQANPPTDKGTTKLATDLFEAVGKLFEDGGCLAPDFYKDDVQVGHTYFMAKDCEELAMKFAYQVYPLLREYFKDGILVPKGGGKIEMTIRSKAFRIDNPEKPDDIFDIILGFCDGNEHLGSEQEEGQASKDETIEEDGMTGAGSSHE
jgi:hypothetical protein